MGKVPRIGGRKHPIQLRGPLLFRCNHRKNENPAQARRLLLDLTANQDKQEARLPGLIKSEGQWFLNAKSHCCLKREG
jgi:hypothetical protein